jgi:hypothetical protein
MSRPQEDHCRPSSQAPPCYSSPLEIPTARFGPYLLPSALPPPPSASAPTLLTVSPTCRFHLPQTPLLHTCATHYGVASPSTATPPLARSPSACLLHHKIWCNIPSHLWDLDSYVPWWLMLCGLLKSIYNHFSMSSWSREHVTWSTSHVTVSCVTKSTNYWKKIDILFSKH